MNIVITMAGLGTRFLKAGYRQPKYKIEVCSKTLFEWSMLSLTDFNQYQDVRYFFVVRKEDASASFIRHKCQKLGIDNYQILEIDEVTDGQSSTALLVQKVWHPDEELIIYNIDTYVEPGIIKRTDFIGDGFIPCFKGDGDHWSFVKLDNRGNATSVKEKNRISDHCSIGLYYFKNCHLFTKAHFSYYDSEKRTQLGEKYVAPIYNWLIKNGYAVRINMLPCDKVHCLGTPEEVAIFKHQMS